MRKITGINNEIISEDLSGVKEEIIKNKKVTLDKHINFYLSKDLMLRLNKALKKERISRSEFIRLCVEKGINEVEEK